MTHPSRTAAKTCRRLLVVLPLAALFACVDSVGPGESGPIEELPRALSQAEQDVIEASNRFGIELVREMLSRDRRANVVLSPFSASMALGMTLNGAAGNTFDEMREVLGFGALSQEEINDSYASLLQLLTTLDPRVEFKVANSVWAEETFSFREEFFEAVRAAFDARVESRDFADPATLDAINDWVSEATEGYIPTILDEINPDLVMFLINAIYFEGTWTERFDPSKTVPAEFTREDGSTVAVDLMNLPDPEVFTRFGPNYAAAEMAYGGGAFAMTLVLPDEGTTIRDLASGIDESWWDDLTGSLREGGVAHLALPRFKTSYGTRLDSALIAMGMEDAFDEFAADFTNLADGGGLFIDEVRQKTFIEVDEAGTRAAAVTSVGIGVTSAPPVFVVDRPFLFAIRERLSGTILFAGLIGDPTLEEVPEL